MFKALLLAIITIFILTVFRMIAGALSKGFSEMTGASGGGGGAAQPRPSAKAAGGALRRDPVCGMFIPEASALTKSVNDETLYFCSQECRDRYAKA